MNKEVKELKKKKIFVKYLVATQLPKEGYKRMFYYTFFSDAPSKYYFGLSLKGVYSSREEMQEIANRGEVVELLEPVLLPYEKEIWLSSEGEIRLASPVNPEEKVTKKLYLREFQKPVQILDNIGIPDSELSYVRKHEVAVA